MLGASMRFSALSQNVWSSEWALWKSRGESFHFILYGDVSQGVSGDGVGPSLWHTSPVVGHVFDDGGWLHLAAAGGIQ